jgi:signal transduction histidine kinase
MSPEPDPEQNASATLETLLAIGRQITGHLDAKAVFEALERHIHGLLPSRTFAIYLLDPGGTELKRAFGTEAGKPLAANAIPLASRSSYSVRCLLEQREFHVEHWPDADHRQVVPGTLANMSALFAPLLAGERAIGVMTVQAENSHAYDDTHRLIFRTLCAYGAIALDNAEAYSRLQQAQARLASQEKLAALGALMAGVAHELNTPIGNSLLIASTLQHKAADLEAAMNGAGLKRSQLAHFVADAQLASDLIMRGLNQAAALVNSFKQVAVDRTSEQRRRFNLRQVCEEVAATMMNRVRSSGHAFELDVPDHITLDSYPGPFGQVLANFINNALLHGFAKKPCGRMRLTAAHSQPGRVLVEFRDDGCGIAREHLGRIFDPFFTTKLGQGGSGLGLSICYNIVTSLLGGQITVDSSAHSGTRFLLDLPLAAPPHEPEAERDPCGAAPSEHIGQLDKPQAIGGAAAEE